MFYTLQSVLENYATFSKEHGENIPSELKPHQEEAEAALHELLKDMSEIHTAWVGPLSTGLGLWRFIPATVVSSMGFTAAGVAAGTIAATAGTTGALFPPLLLVGGIGAAGVGGFIGIKHAINRQRQYSYNREHQEQLQDLHEKIQYLCDYMGSVEPK